MGQKRIKEKMKITKSKLKTIIKEELNKVMQEMFGKQPDMKIEKGDVWAYYTEPDSIEHQVVVQSHDDRTVLIKAKGNGFISKGVKTGMKFRVPTHVFMQAFIEKSTEIDPDTGKQVNIINLSERLKGKTNYRSKKDYLNLGDQ